MKPALTKRVLEALWYTQWTSKWAAENTACAHGCGRKADIYSDQEAHYADCDFVKLWDDLKAEREAAGVKDYFEAVFE